MHGNLSCRDTCDIINKAAPRGIGVGLVCQCTFTDMTSGPRESIKRDTIMVYGEVKDTGEFVLGSMNPPNCSASMAQMTMSTFISNIRPVGHNRAPTLRPLALDV